jgi:CheY-like chemotaxis protein
MSPSFLWNENGNWILTEITADDASVLIAASPGRMRDSLRLLLSCALGSMAVDLADDSPTACQIVTEQCPALVLLDTNLPGGLPVVLSFICSNGAQSRCLVLVDNVRQQREAHRAGADAALLRGFSAAELYVVVGRLLAAWQDER